MAGRDSALSGNGTFVAMRDRFYTSTGIAIETEEGRGRVFPPYLDENRPVEIPPEFRQLHEAGPLTVELNFQVEEFDLGRLRSEERRVGKGCRSRWGRDQETERQ